jgi:hypothetical protein
MRKLLHLAFALGKSDKPFAGDRHKPLVRREQANAASSDSLVLPKREGESDHYDREEQSAGHKPEAEPAEEVVTAACAGTVAPSQGVGEGTLIDFAHLKSQLPMTRVLDHLGLSEERLLRGSGAQCRCACPIHRGDGRGRTFSVNVQENVFCCFDSRCGKQGDVIDLWAALRQMSLREAGDRRAKGDHIGEENGPTRVEGRQPGDHLPVTHSVGLV